MKKILILGGSHRDIPLIKASQDLGYFVITLGNKDYYLGHNYSNKAYKINFNDLEKDEIFLIDHITPNLSFHNIQFFCVMDDDLLKFVSI